MAKRASGRWKGWRISPSGRNIKSDPEKDPEWLRRKAQLKKLPPSGRPKPKRNRWCWILSKFDGQCSDCGRGLREGIKVAFAYPAKTVLCVTCAEKTGVAERCKPSAELRERVRREESALGNWS